jgi:hypothetical protein
MKMGGVEETSVAGLSTSWNVKECGVPVCTLKNNAHAMKRGRNEGAKKHEKELST